MNRHYKTAGLGMLVCALALALTAGCKDTAPPTAPTPTTPPTAQPAVITDCEPVLEDGLIVAYELVTYDAISGAEVSRTPLLDPAECP